MTISDRRLDKLRLGELEPEEAKEVFEELEERGELHRLHDLEAEADAFLDSHPPGPAVQRIREDVRRAGREPSERALPHGPHVAQERKSRSTAMIGVLALVALGVLVVPMMMQPSGQRRGSSLDPKSTPFIAWQESDIDCVGAADCRDKALRAYRRGEQLADARSEQVANAYEAYASFARAQMFLERGRIEPAPDEMAGMPTLKADLKEELDEAFRQARIDYRNHKSRRMYHRMAQALEEIQERFPDERSLYNRWATQQERTMKEDGTYPTPPPRNTP